MKTIKSVRRKVGNILHMVDRYNNIKEWLVKRDKSGHYYLAQLVSGKQWGKVTRRRKADIEDVLNVRIKVEKSVAIVYA